MWVMRLKITPKITMDKIFQPERRLVLSRFLCISCWSGMPLNHKYQPIGFLAHCGRAHYLPTYYTRLFPFCVANIRGHRADDNGVALDSNAGDDVATLVLKRRFGWCGARLYWRRVHHQHHRTAPHTLSVAKTWWRTIRRPATNYLEKQLAQRIYQKKCEKWWEEFKT